MLFLVSTPLVKLVLILPLAGTLTTLGPTLPFSYAPWLMTTSSHAAPWDRCETPFARISQRVVPANTSIIFPAVSDQMLQKPSLLANASISTQRTQYQYAVVDVRYPNCRQQMWHPRRLLFILQTSPCPSFGQLSGV